MYRATKRETRKNMNEREREKVIKKKQANVSAELWNVNTNFNHSTETLTFGTRIFIVHFSRLICVYSPYLFL